MERRHAGGGGRRKPYTRQREGVAARPDWHQLCAFACVELGIASSKDFLLLSPRQYARKAKHARTLRERAERHQELLLAQLTAMVANTGFRSFEQPREAKEFMPSEWAREAQYRPKRLTRQQQQARDLFFMKRLVAYQNANVERGIA